MFYDYYSAEKNVLILWFLYVNDPEPLLELLSLASFPVARHEEFSSDPSGADIADVDVHCFKVLWEIFQGMQYYSFDMH